MDSWTHGGSVDWNSSGICCWIWLLTVTWGFCQPRGIGQVEEQTRVGCTHPAWSCSVSKWVESGAIAFDQRICVSVEAVAAAEEEEEMED
jgi:hypothetical protein